MSDRHTALARLDDYVRRLHDDEDAYEEDLFSRALEGNAPEAIFHAGLGSTLRRMNARGALELWLTAKDVERVRASGLRAFFWEWNPADQAPLDIPPDADVVIVRIGMPLEGVRAVVGALGGRDGPNRKRRPHGGLEAAGGAE